MHEHLSGKVKSTSHRLPLLLIYWEGCLNQQDATRREKYLKSGSEKIYLKSRLRNFFKNPTGWMSLCPNKACMFANCTPLSIRCVAKQCLRVCGVTLFVIPAFLSAFLTTFCTLLEEYCVYLSWPSKSHICGMYVLCVSGNIWIIKWILSRKYLEYR